MTPRRIVPGVESLTTHNSYHRPASVAASIGPGRFRQSREVRWTEPEA